MNSYDTHNLSYIRRNHGLLWKKSYPTFSDLRGYFKNAGVIAFLLACYCLVALNDARAIAVEGELQASQSLVNLASGGTILSEDGSFAAKCGEWVEVKK